jgi:peptidoglycan/xylan/chitin deacetylase (PgdA/CDA1 family)
VDWAQPPSLDKGERRAASLESREWRRTLFAGSDLGLRRVRVAQPGVDVQVIEPGPGYTETDWPETTDQDLLASSLWRYPARLPVLAYHAVSDTPGDRYAVPPRLFEQHMELLARHFRFVTTSQAHATWQENGRFPNDLGLLTFDDGYRDLTAIAPLLDDLNIKVTLFVPVQWIGQENTWDRGAFTRRRHLDWIELGELAASGHEVGSHTLDHYRLTTLSIGDAARQVIESKAALESRLGQPVRAISYPFGSVNATVIDVVRTHYDVGFTTGHGGTFGWDEEPCAIRRIVVDAHQDPRGLLSRIADYMMQAPDSEPVWRPTLRSGHGPEQS